MGCGHSKINIYPKRAKNKTNGKKAAATPEKTVENGGDEEEGGILDKENPENSEHLEECDSKKTIKVKPFGGPLLAQTEISSSQQDFFKMLDEKIQNGPDYNSESETERAAEAARLNALLKDWETASAGSRSLPATPKRRLKTSAIVDKTGTRSADTVRTNERGYPTQIPQNVIHQSYGVTAAAMSSYHRHHHHQPVTYPPSPPVYNHPQQSSPSHASYPSAALQYQAISPMYTAVPQAAVQAVPMRQYPVVYCGSPMKTYTPNKHIPYDPATYSPSHKMPYSAPPTGRSTVAYSNGELQYYNQMQYQQVLGTQPSQTAVNYRRNYQSSVTIPIAVQSSQNGGEMGAHRKQYELT